MLVCVDMHDCVESNGKLESYMYAPYVYNIYACTQCIRDNLHAISIECGVYT